MSLVEEIPAAARSLATGYVTIPTRAGGRMASTFQHRNSAAVQRALARRLADLDREQHQQSSDAVLIRIDGNHHGGAGKTAGVRKILGSKKTLANLFDEDDKGTHAFLSAAAAPSRYPARKLCSVCGYLGTITCMRCSERYCSLQCEDTHRETRCLKIYA
ncbi:uncharacterized protein V1518DRAFT_20611 [Limtongia smithiae]|uniref:uncharacterized protein n=1 Tax=Limtongia smithiae TaxID=1125753 RepID=UPI0034CE6532